MFKTISISYQNSYVFFLIDNNYMTLKHLLFLISTNITPYEIHTLHRWCNG